ncbi:polyprenyl synthetase family protein [Halodurantibacterium flavum]|uniref:Polyprenyl synthetase family protein n=1 Tax=Halodurantibacterium flavum TaxID=1382802 RepID=A0ABW4S3J1_9RHOB
MRDTTEAFSRPRATPALGLLDQFETELAARLPASGPAPRLIEAMDYVLMAPSKRFRAGLVLLLAEAADVPRAAALDLAAAIEMLHGASLIFDDLPCMDDAPLRRGRASAHAQFGESVAVLAGISLLSLAYEVVATSADIPADRRAAIVALLTGSVGHAGLSAGQDLDLHGDPSGGVGAVTVAHRLKTGSLFLASVRAVAALADLPPPQTEALCRFADALGLAFQAYDDLIDLAAGAEAEAAHGKTTQRDGTRLALTQVLERAQIAALYAARVAEVETALTETGLDVGPLRDYVGQMLARRLPA